MPDRIRRLTANFEVHAELLHYDKRDIMAGQKVPLMCSYLPIYYWIPPNMNNVDTITKNTFSEHFNRT